MEKRGGDNKRSRLGKSEDYELGTPKETHNLAPELTRIVTESSILSGSELPSLVIL